MIEEACLAIEQMSEHERRARELKYARRRKMRYIDKLLNELEMLNLSDQVKLPGPISVAVDRLLEDADVRQSVEAARPETVCQAMDVLYEVQDSLMFNQYEDE